MIKNVNTFLQKFWLTFGLTDAVFFPHPKSYQWNILQTMQK